jgi:thiol-disulfide isomerase/thioredoxin
MINALPSSFNPARAGPPALIVVGVTWCGHCQDFKPELESWKSALPARVYWADGDHDERTKQWSIEGYPTILYRPSTGGLHKYLGPRTLSGVQRFIRTLER